MRKPPPSEPVARRRRERALSSEERELWDSVARQANPLRKSRRSPQREADIAAPAQPEPPAAEPPRTISVAPKRSPAPPPLAPLGRRERAQVAKGRKTIGARLDLHGMTQARAHAVLLAFLQRAAGEGHAMVLVITGKGRMGEGERERGVLRRQVPLWLALPEFRALVIGFDEAHIGHGGAGALYVRIRRTR